VVDAKRNTETRYKQTMGTIIVDFSNQSQLVGWSVDQCIQLQSLKDSSANEKV